jgi:hypothetical protein
MTYVGQEVLFKVAMCKLLTGFKNDLLDFLGDEIQQ